MARDDFTRAIKVKLAERAGYKCSICHAATVGPSAEGEEAVSRVGEAAHITAAAPGGPRYDASLTPDQRSAITNGIWLCAVHAKIVDDDSTTYTVEELEAFKRDAERRASAALGRPAHAVDALSSGVLEVRPVAWEYVPGWRAVVVAVDLVNRSDRAEGLESVALDLGGRVLEPVVPLAKSIEGRVWLTTTVRLKAAGAVRGAWYFGRAAGVGGDEAIITADVTAHLRVKPIRGQEEVAALQIVCTPAAGDERDLALRDEAALRHDRVLFESLDVLLSEEALSDLLTRVAQSHAVHMSQRRILDEYAHRSRLERSRFTDSRLNEKHVLLVERIEALLLFFARQFFVYPREKQGPDLQVALRPDWSADRGSPNPEHEARYDALARELGHHIDDALKGYATYRRAVRELLQK